MISDLFTLTNLQLSDTTIFQQSKAKMTFSVTLTNSHGQGIDIPVSNGGTMFDFKVKLAFLI